MIQKNPKQNSVPHMAEGDPDKEGLSLKPVSNGSQRLVNQQLAPMPATYSSNSPGQESKPPINYSGHIDHGGIEISIPKEDKVKVSCCWRVMCPCYYLFCCCCCCETGMKVTKMRFVDRFNKWINIVSLFLGLLSHSEKIPNSRPL